MKKIIILFSATFLFVLFFSPLFWRGVGSEAFAQEVTINWSEQQIYDNKIDGFFDDFIGNNSKYIYAKFTKNASVEKYKFKKIKLVAFDKTTMDKEADASVKGFKENQSDAEKYQGLEYYKTIVFENILYVFWTKNAGNKEELYVQSYDSKLNKLKPVKKIYEIPEGGKGEKRSSIFVLGNKKSNERIVIGAELPAKKGENVKVEYKVLNVDFSFSASNQISLPVTITGTRGGGLTSSYEFGDDGNLYISTLVSLTKEEVKTAKTSKEPVVYRYPILTLVDVSSGKTTPFAIKAENKNIFNFNYIADKNSVKVFGFFCDFQKDPKGNDTHGIFYSIIDNKTFSMQNINFSYLTKAQLDKLFTKDIEDRKDKTSKMRSKKKQDSESESLKSDYVIENVQSIDNDNIVLFCSRMYNYSVRSCDSKGNCTTRYYCQKNNVTVFKVGKDGNIVWATNMDRRKTYNGWDIYDVSVINNNNKFYVIYGSDYMTGAAKKKSSSRKRKDQRIDRLEYAVFDYSDGAFAKKEYKVNAINAKKQEKKMISPTNIDVFDNKFYTTSLRATYKPAQTALACLGCLVCPPGAIITYPMWLGSIQKGFGFVGNIAPVK